MRNQNHSLYKRVKRFRSDSEERHLEVLQGMLPGWTVAHEPGSEVSLDSPLVVDGVRQDWAGSTYLVDYVAMQNEGCGRISFESKSSVEQIDSRHF